MRGQVTRDRAGRSDAATVVGRREHLRHLVKAITLNKLEFTHEGAIWHGCVVLDV